MPAPLIDNRVILICMGIMFLLDILEFYVVFKLFQVVAYLHDRVDAAPEPVSTSDQ